LRRLPHFLDRLSDLFVGGVSWQRDGVGVAADRANAWYVAELDQQERTAPGQFLERPDLDISAILRRQLL
jgi:hypothetical protein